MATTNSVCSRIAGSSVKQTKMPKPSDLNNTANERSPNIALGSWEVLKREGFSDKGVMSSVQAGIRLERPALQKRGFKLQTEDDTFQSFQLGANPTIHIPGQRLHLKFANAADKAARKCEEALLITYGDITIQTIRVDQEGVHNGIQQIP